MIDIIFFIYVGAIFINGIIAFIKDLIEEYRR